MLTSASFVSAFGGLEKFCPHKRTYWHTNIQTYWQTKQNFLVEVARKRLSSLMNSSRIVDATSNVTALISPLCNMHRCSLHLDT